MTDRAPIVPVVELELRPYKFLVQAVVQSVDGKGNPTGEVEVAPVILFGCDELAKWARSFPKKLAEAGTPPVPDAPPKESAPKVPRSRRT